MYLNWRCFPDVCIVITNVYPCMEKYYVPIDGTIVGLLFRKCSCVIHRNIFEIHTHPSYCMESDYSLIYVLIPLIWYFYLIFSLSLNLMLKFVYFLFSIFNTLLYETFLKVSKSSYLRFLFWKTNNIFTV